ncbi:MAG TPA: SDR family oxidoreductase [Pseudolysinimonas sp.]|nr:SDR family oxidoreductase [Pseudolysinimonas sp.]
MADPLLDLTGHRVLLTGGSGALGREIRWLVSAHGAAVASVDLAGTGDPPTGVVEITADLSTTAGVDLAWDATVASIGMPTVVCAHAGAVISGDFDRQSDSDWDQVIGINLTSASRLARRAVIEWVAAKVPGHLITTTSWVQDVPWPGITPYAASKAGLRALTRGIAREYAAAGIRANSVAPGIVGAGMALKQWEEEPEYRARARRAIPLGRLQEPQSVANAFLFLLSPMASYMTGATLLVDGGASLYPMD